MAKPRLDLDDDLNVSDLRKVDTWLPRLSKAGKLRLQRRGEVIGILLSPGAWRELTSQNERYEQALRFIENEHDSRIIAKRDGDALTRGKALSAAVGRELKEAGLI